MNGWAELIRFDILGPTGILCVRAFVLCDGCGFKSYVHTIQRRYGRGRGNGYCIHRLALAKPLYISVIVHAYLKPT